MTASSLQLLRLQELVATTAGPPFQRYLANLSAIRGNIDWSLTNFRYFEQRYEATWPEAFLQAPSDDSPLPLPIPAIAWWWETAL